MKRKAAKLLYHVGRLIRWRWLMISSGLLIISSSTSCKTHHVRCYDAVPVDSTKVEEPTCYKVAVPSHPNPNDSVSVPSNNSQNPNNEK